MAQTARPDVDLEEDVLDVIAHYPPLQADRFHLRTDIHEGIVTLSGHVGSLVSRRYLIDHVIQVRGVASVISDRLYTEEGIRMETGRAIPKGVFANVSYGTVILTGSLPADASAEAIIKAVAAIPGVERVVTRF